MIKLELKCRNLMAKEYRLDDGNVRSIGRDAANHIAVEDQCVSRNHAALVRLGERLFIWDEGSKHGTFINGLQVICGELADGDLVTIGADYSLVVTVSVSRREDRSTALGNAWEHLAATK